MQSSIQNLLNRDTPQGANVICAAVVADMTRMADKFAQFNEGDWPTSRGAYDKLCQALFLQLAPAVFRGSWQHAEPVLEALVRISDDMANGEGEGYEGDLYSAADSFEDEYIKVITGRLEQEEIYAREGYCDV